MNRIRQCRVEAGFSQKYVAISLGVSPPTVCDWETGKKNPNHKNIDKLADLLNVSVDYLIGRTDIRNADIKEKHAANGSELDEKLISLLCDLSPSEVQRVQDFVAGLKATRTE